LDDDPHRLAGGDIATGTAQAVADRPALVVAGMEPDGTKPP